MVTATIPAKLMKAMSARVDQLRDAAMFIACAKNQRAALHATLAELRVMLDALVARG